MTTYLFTWNERVFRWLDFGKHYRRVQQGKRARLRWTSGNSRNIPKGARFYLLRQGAELPSGIVGAGWTTTRPTFKDEWDGNPAYFNWLEFDALLDPHANSILDVKELLKIDSRRGFWGVASSGVRVPEAIEARLAAKWKQVLKRNGMSGRETAGDETLAPLIEARTRAWASVITRPQQGAFRNALTRRYGNQCQISGCGVMGVVHACHIKRVADGGAEVVQNGILLRLDLHVLFDADLIGIDPKTMEVHIHPSLKGTEYNDFAGTRVRAQPSPSVEALTQRWRAFRQSF